MACVNCVMAGCLISDLRAAICTPKEVANGLVTDGGVDESTGSAPLVDEVSGVTKEGKDAMGRNRLKDVKTPVVYVLAVESAKNMVVVVMNC